MPVYVPQFPYPVINGKYFQFSSIKCLMGGKEWNDILEINYQCSREVGEVYGISPVMLGRTFGQVKASADITMYRHKLDEFLSIVDPANTGFMGVENIPFEVGYAERFMPTMSDRIIGAQILGIENGHSQGNEPLKAKIPLSIIAVVYNGKQPVPGLIL